MNNPGWVIIPAYQPGAPLLKLLRELSSYPQLHILVVDDGSGLAYSGLFQESASYATILAHERNRGKGRAIKTALSYIRLQENKDASAPAVFVTADADGQHKTEDILRVLRAARHNQTQMILGSRNFNRQKEGKSAGRGRTGIPARSLLGNRFTAAAFKKATGIRLQDTQTGLRACSVDFIPLLLSVPGERYEYETNVLLTVAKQHIEFQEVPIETIYEDGNAASHFRAVRDSGAIFWNILKFSSASLLSFCIDYCAYGVLLFLFSLTGAAPFLVLAGSNLLARLLSGTCNFFLNQGYVFHYNGSLKKAAETYILLAAGILLANTGLLALLVSVLGMNRMLAKLVTELSLFLFSFLIQHYFIFKRGE